MLRRSLSLTAIALAACFASAPLGDAVAKPKPADAEPEGGKRAAKAPSKTDSKGEQKRGADGDDDKAKSKRKPGGASIGSPNRGHLEGGVRLKPSGHVKVREGARVWGVAPLVRLLHRVADRVASRHGGSALLVGDLSAKRGGKLDGHHSHQSGRDADIGFYVANSKGKPVHVSRFLAFDAEGRVKKDGPKWARFDDARNWMLVQELLEDDRAPVRYVFVANHLRARLLKFAASKKVSKDLYDRAAAAMISPDGADVHDDHFHVRIACPETMRAECVEESGAREPKPTGDAVADAAADTPRASGKSAAPAGDTSRPTSSDDPY
jgi:penicillin-insensitive murein endopeptidase